MASSGSPPAVSTHTRWLNVTRAFTVSPTSQVPFPRGPFAIRASVTRSATSGVQSAVSAHTGSVYGLRAAPARFAATRKCTAASWPAANVSSVGSPAPAGTALLPAPVQSDTVRSQGAAVHCTHQTSTWSRARSPGQPQANRSSRSEIASARGSSGLPGIPSGPASSLSRTCVSADPWPSSQPTPGASAAVTRLMPSCTASSIVSTSRNASVVPVRTVTDEGGLPSSIAASSVTATGRTRSNSGAGFAVTTKRTVSPSVTGPAPCGRAMETTVCAVPGVAPRPALDHALHPRALRARTPASQSVSGASPSSTAPSTPGPYDSTVQLCAPSARWRSSYSRIVAGLPRSPGALQRTSSVSDEVARSIGAPGAPGSRPSSSSLMCTIASNASGSIT